MRQVVLGVVLGFIVAVLLLSLLAKGPSAAAGRDAGMAPPAPPPSHPKTLLDVRTGQLPSQASAGPGTLRPVVLEWDAGG